MSEKVFCFPKEFMGGFTGGSFNSFQVLNSGLSWLEHCYNNGLFLDRDFVEGNPDYKQLIPYIVLSKMYSKKTIFSYVRSGSEKRLSGLHSIGIGGHINPCDFGPSMQDTLRNCIAREIEEELEGFGRIDGIIGSDDSYNGPSLKPLGLLYLNDSNPVNQDHIGFLIGVSCYNDDIRMNDEGKDSRWDQAKSLKKVDLEPWSEIALGIYKEFLNYYDYR